MPIDQTNQRLLQTMVPQHSGVVTPPSDPMQAPAPQATTQAAVTAPPLSTAVSQALTAEPSAAQSVTTPEPTVAQPVPTATPLAQNDDLVLLERVLAEAEQTVPQAVPTAMLQTVAEATQALTPNTGTGGKETVGAAAKNVVEAGGATQYVEYEPNPELPPEVEGYLNKTEQHANQAPPEVVIADTSAPLPNDRQLPSQPVVVLPITPEIEKVGMTKTPQFSIRWLVEWSHKIMKMFVGNVIYFQKK